MKKILITGGCGFIGHHFIEHVLLHTEWRVYVLDKLTYASHGLERLRDNRALDSKRVTLFTYDLSHSLSVGLQEELQDISYIVHMAADTHIDHSISDPVPFIYNNIMFFTMSIMYTI